MEIALLGGSGISGAQLLTVKGLDLLAQCPHAGRCDLLLAALVRAAPPLSDDHKQVRPPRPSVYALSKLPDIWAPRIIGAGALAPCWHSGSPFIHTHISAVSGAGSCHPSLVPHPESCVCVGGCPEGLWWL